MTDKSSGSRPPSTKGGTASGRAKAASRDPADIPALVSGFARTLREHDLTELRVESDDLRIVLSRATTVTAAPRARAPLAADGSAPQPAARLPAEPSAGDEAEIDFADHPGVIKAPMVGTVYLSPEPGAPSFVKEGDDVREGQTLLLIEAMKTFNAVSASRAGRLTRILVGDGQPVEYGEPLLTIE